LKSVILSHEPAEHSKMKFICILLVITLYLEVESRRIIESEYNQDNKTNDKIRYKRRVVSDFLYLWQMPINYMLDESLSN
jgi:hypothetical protein